MRFTCLLCITLLSVWHGDAQEIFPSRKNGFYGYIDTTGSWVLVPRFKKAGLYINGRAIAIAEDTLFLIHNKHEITAIPGLRNYALLNKNFYALQNGTGKWALADSNFNLISGFSYTKIESSDTLFKVWNNGFAGLINKCNKLLLTEQFNQIEILSNGNYRAVNGLRTRIYKMKDSMRLMLDNSGIEYNPAYPGIYIQKIKKTKKSIFYNLDGDTLYKCHNCLIKAKFNEQLFIQENKNLIILNTKNGRIRNDIISMSDVQISRTIPGFMFLKSKGEFYNDTNESAFFLGEGIDSVEYASDSYLFFRKKGFWGLIDFRGNIKIEPRFQTIAIIDNLWAEAYTFRNKTFLHLPSSKSIFTTSTFAEISPDSNSILVHKSSQSVLYELDEEMNVSDSAVFKNMGRYTAGRKQGVVMAGNAFMGAQNRNFSKTQRWFNQKGYYGLKGLNNDTIYPAIFTSVYGINDSTDVVTMKSGFMMLKQIHGKGIVYSDELFGILNNRTGRYYLAPVFAFIDYLQFADTSLSVVRVVNKGGNFALMQKSDYSILSHTACSYISPVSGGTMRLFYKAVFYGVDKQIPPVIKTFPKFLAFVTSFGEFGKLDVKTNFKNMVYVCASAVNVADKNGQLVWDYETAKKFTFLENGLFQNYISVNHEGKYGVISQEKNIIIMNEYSFISRLQTDPRYFVLKTGNLKYGYVNNEGNELSNALFNEARMFHDMHAWARIGDSLIIIDKAGNIQDPGFKQAKTGPVSEGISSIRTRKGWLLTDLNGEPISDLYFRQVKVFMNGSVAVLYGAEWGLIDAGGQWVMKPRFSDFEAENKNAVVFKHGNKFYFVSREGVELGKIRARGDVAPLGDLYFKLENKAGSSKIYRNDGSEFRKNRFNAEVRSQGDTILVVSNYRLVAWNNQGKRMTSLRHHGGHSYVDKGLVKIGDKRSRNEYIELKIFDSYRFLNPGVFSDSSDHIKIYKPRIGNAVTLVNRNIPECIRYNVFVFEIKNTGSGKWFILCDSLGNLLSEQWFKSTRYVGGGMFSVELQNQHSAIVSGVINAAGLWVLEPKFKSITEFKSGVAVYSKENDFWIADTNGNLISDQSFVEYSVYKGFYLLLSDNMSAWWHPEKGWLSEFSR